MVDFLSCSCCDECWTTRDAFLDDPRTALIGYQVDFLDLTAGYLLFNHNRDECGSTLAVEVERFADLYEGPEHPRALFGTAECGGRCGRIEDLTRCDRPCRNAWVRELLAQIVERQAAD